jgi:hypothetical protein
VSSGAKTAADVVAVGASVKLHAVRDVRIALPTGRISDLADGLDNRIRNAGDGHESWEIDDDGNVLLHITDPKTGSTRRPMPLKLTIDELAKFVDRVRRTIWSIETGMAIYMTNSSAVRDRLLPHRNSKIAEIVTLVENFARERWLSIKSMEIERDRSAFSITLAYEPIILGEDGQIVLGSGEAYDLIKVESRVPYKYQVLGVLQYAVWEFFPETNPPRICAVVLDEHGKDIGKVEFERDEVRKLYSGTKEEPIPSSGALPEGEYMIAGELRVPFGQRAEFSQVLEESGLLGSMKISRTRS